jgi:radical SAM superfamily enzyme YgiQ (UPF0313 family)
MGITAMTHEIGASGRVAARTRELLDAPVVIGGCHVTALPRKTMVEFPAFDYGVYGEGERVFLELARRLRDSYPEASHDIGGLVYREGDEVTINARPDLLTPAELGALPFSSMDDYYGENHGALEPRAACYSLAASRGNSHVTCFDVQVLGRLVRRRPEGHVIEEMERAIAAWGAHTFEFNDDMFFGDDASIQRLLRLMIARRLPSAARWSASIGVEQVDPALMSLAARAGCFRLDLLAGSGDDGTLERFNEGVTSAMVARAARRIQDSGIRVHARVILGHPNETWSQAARTTLLAGRLGADSVSLEDAVPYPGTAVYEMALRGAGGYRLMCDDWSEYDEFGHCVLELESLPRWQRDWLRCGALLGFYLGKLRLLALAKYLWNRRRVYYYSLKRRLGIRIVTKESFTG